MPLVGGGRVRSVQQRGWHGPARALARRCAQGSAESPAGGGRGRAMLGRGRDEGGVQRRRRGEAGPDGHDHHPRGLPARALLRGGGGRPAAGAVRRGPPGGARVGPRWGRVPMAGPRLRPRGGVVRVPHELARGQADGRHRARPDPVRGGDPLHEAGERGPVRDNHRRLGGLHPAGEGGEARAGSGWGQFGHGRRPGPSDGNVWG
mmetsp:Transcript_39953/g.83602  ORF Transcript_39953/g.83602 Transcript_39953/m.83602 type:complete len:205 (+) Transcript_39953:1005-1619(+)